MQFPEEGQCHGAPLPAPVPLFGLGGGPHFFLTRGHGGSAQGASVVLGPLGQVGGESHSVLALSWEVSSVYDCLPEVMLFREVSLSALGMGATDGTAEEPRAGSAEQPPNPGPGGRGSNISQGVLLLLPFPSPTPGTPTRLKPL